MRGTLTLVEPGAPARRGATENGILGTALIVFTEVMLFAAFISAFVIAQNAARPGAWPPPDQPRLPIERTALNTLALLASGVALQLAHRAWRRNDRADAARKLGISIALGAFFVLFQGAEWAALIRQGLTLQSSQLGSFFYLIIGAHALHAVVALAILCGCWGALRNGTLTRSRFGGAQLFWYFVVLVWPLLYWQVYL
jgi:cytochrome c oxidase subunit III